MEYFKIKFNHHPHLHHLLILVLQLQKFLQNILSFYVNITQILKVINYQDLRYFENYQYVLHCYLYFVIKILIVKLILFIHLYQLTLVLQVKMLIYFIFLHLRSKQYNLCNMINELVLHLKYLQCGNRRMELLVYRCLIEIRNCILHCLRLLLKIDLDYL